MLSNYLIAAVRNFRRNRLISLINLLGLSLGLASCLVAGLFCKHELSANRFHEDIASIYRVTTKMRQFSMSGTPYLFAETVQRDFPQVQATLRTTEQETSVRIGTDLTKERIIFSDPGFFNFFTFELAQGNTDHALDGLRNVVISERIYRKYFGREDAIGKVISINLNNMFIDFEVSGVLEPPPAYSSIDFDFLVPLENRFIASDRMKSHWGNFFFTSFVKTDPTGITALQEAMPEFALRYLESSRNADGTSSASFTFMPLSTHHLTHGNPGAGLAEGRSASDLWILAGIALIILGLACFNFMNLTNAQSSRRALEIGIRKVSGASRNQLVPQFLFEGILISLFAAVISLGIAELSLLIFRDDLGVAISIFDPRHLDVYCALLGVAFCSGALAGAYPAVVLANLHATDTFKRHFRVGGSNWLTRVVLATQFCVSIILIACALIMWKQQHFLLNKNLGFNKEQVLVLPFGTNDSSAMTFMQHELLKLPAVIDVAKTSGAFTRGNNATVQKLPDGSEVFVYVQSIDERYVRTMEMELSRGESFSVGHAKNRSAILVNETMIKTFHLEDSIGIPLGKSIGWIEHPTIIGVVRDFHHAQLKHEIAPIMLTYNQPMEEGYLMVRLAREEVAAGLQQVEALWEEKRAAEPFEFFFLDDDIDQQYATEERWSRMVTLATGIAIFLSTLGLLGLSIFTLERRKKEIGVRKVLGASLEQLLMLLSRSYLWLIAVSFMVAAPVSWYLMTEYWLEGFAYRIAPGFSTYAIALLVVLVIVAVAVGLQMLTAARQNPAYTLKDE